MEASTTPTYELQERRLIDLLDDYGRIPPSLQTEGAALEDLPFILYAQAEFYARTGNQAVALEAVRESLRRDSASPLGWALYLKIAIPGGDVSKLRQLVGAHPHLSRPQVHLGFVLLQQGFAGEAAASFERSIEINDRDVGAWWGLGWARLQLGHRAFAEEAAIRALSLARSGTITPTLLYRVGRRKEARKLARRNANEWRTWRRTLLPWLLPLAAASQPVRIGWLFVTILGGTWVIARSLAGNPTVWWIDITTGLLLTSLVLSRMVLGTPGTRSSSKRLVSMAGQSFEVPEPAYLLATGIGTGGRREAKRRAHKSPNRLLGSAFLGATVVGVFIVAQLASQPVARSLPTTSDLLLVGTAATSHCDRWPLTTTIVSVFFGPTRDGPYSEQAHSLGISSTPITSAASMGCAIRFRGIVPTRRYYAIAGSTFPIAYIEVYLGRGETYSSTTYGDIHYSITVSTPPPP